MKFIICVYQLLLVNELIITELLIWR